MYNLVGDKIRELLEQRGKSINDLARQTDIASSQWAKVIKGSSRLSVDLAIRLGKVFPYDIKEEEINHIYLHPGYHLPWLCLQFLSDLENANEQDGPMYSKIKPLWANRVMAIS